MDVVPMVVIVVSVMFVFGLWFTGGRSDPFRARLQGVLWGAAFVAAGLLQLGHLPWPITVPLGGVVIAAVLLTGFIVWNPRSVGGRYLVRALFVAAVGLLVLFPLRNSLTGPVHFRNLLAFFFLGLGVWSILERTAQHVKPPALILLPALSLAALLLFLKQWISVIESAEVSLMTTSVTLHLSLVIAALLTALAFPARVSAAAAIPFVSVLLVGQLTAVHFYLRTNPWTMVWIASPFLVLWIRNWIPLISREPRGEAATLAALALLPLAYLFWGGL